MKTKIEALAAGISATQGGFLPLPEKKQDSKCINMDDKWNRYLAIGIFAATILFIIMIIALAKVYIPKTSTGGGKVSFDVVKSTRYLYYSYAAYSNPTQTSWNCPYCGGPVANFALAAVCQGNQSYAYVGYDNSRQEIIVAIRGPVDDTDWLMDLSNVQKPPSVVFPGYSQRVLVNELFYLEYKAFKQCVLDEVTNLVPQAHYPLVVVGHSYGGGLASLAAVDILTNTNIHGGVSLYTFGAPRVGNQGFAGALTALLGVKVQRMVNGGDCVARLPDQQFGYKHPPYEIWEHPADGNKYKVCSASGEDTTCSISSADTCIPHKWYMGFRAPN